MKPLEFTQFQLDVLAAHAEYRTALAEEDAAAIAHEHAKARTAAATARIRVLARAEVAS